MKRQQKSNSKPPFMSVVLITFNGSATVRLAIESLQKQSYKAYEIIVVDDGSSDDTPQIIKAYKGIKIVSLSSNQGISAARNAGLAAAKGDVYVCFDDDCVVGPKYLEQLARGYGHKNVMGVGSMVVGKANRTLVEQFIHQNDKNVFTRKTQDFKLPGLLGVFEKYYRHNLARTSSGQRAKTIEVTELYGLSSSFRTDVLRAINGWDEQMSGIEDRDISLRLKKQFSDQRFLLMPSAKLIHDRGLPAVEYLLRPWKRGPVNFKFHTDHGLRLPLFFLPPAYVVLCVTLALLQPVTALIALIALPVLLYFWWPLKAFWYRKPAYISFAYLQFAEESVVLLGLLKGWLRARRTA